VDRRCLDQLSEASADNRNGSRQGCSDECVLEGDERRGDERRGATVPPRTSVTLARPTTDRRQRTRRLMNSNGNVSIARQAEIEQEFVVSVHEATGGCGEAEDLWREFGRAVGEASEDRASVASTSVCQEGCESRKGR
jgi:hypothetical protein